MLDLKLDCDPQVLNELAIACYAFEHLYDMDELGIEPDKENMMYDYLVCYFMTKANFKNQDVSDSGMEFILDLLKPALKEQIV